MAFLVAYLYAATKTSTPNRELKSFKQTPVFCVVYIRETAESNLPNGDTGFYLAGVSI